MRTSSDSSRIGQNEHYYDAVEYQPENATPTTISHNESTQSVATGSVNDATERGALSPNEKAIHSRLSRIFEKHIDADNCDALDKMILTRTKQLHSMGETPESIEATILKGLRLNRANHFLRGAVRSIPFAASSMAIDSFPVLSSFAHHAALLGMNAGMQASLADTFGCSLLNRMTADVTWMQAKENELEPVMQTIFHKKQPTETALAAENSLSIQYYSLRNALRIGLNSGVSAWKGPAVAAQVDSYFSAVGGIVSGGLMSVTNNEVNLKKNRIGPEYLFSRVDWAQQYNALKNTSPFKDGVTSGVKRAASFPLDVITDSPAALRALATAGGLGKTAIMAGGVGAVSWARSAVMAAMGSAHFSSASTQAMSHLVNTLGLAPIYASVPAVEIMGEKLGNDMSHAIHETPNAITSAASWLGKQFQGKMQR